MSGASTGMPAPTSETDGPVAQPHASAHARLAITTLFRIESLLRLDERCIPHSGSIFAPRMMRPHFSDSLAWKAARPSGVLVTTSPAVELWKAMIDGVASA